MIYESFSYKFSYSTLSSKNSVAAVVLGTAKLVPKRCSRYQKYAKMFRRHNTEVVNNNYQLVNNISRQESLFN